MWLNKPRRELGVEAPRERRRTVEPLERVEVEHLIEEVLPIAIPAKYGLMSGYMAFVISNGMRDAMFLAAVESPPNVIGPDVPYEVDYENRQDPHKPQRENPAPCRPICLVAGQG
jgi:hypothetical protein